MKKTTSDRPMKLKPSTIALLATVSLLGMSSVVTIKSTQPALAQAVQEQITTSLYQKASPAVVTIKTGNGHGSGFLVSQDGLIITNAHVVEGGPQIVTVKFNNGQQVSADVIGFAKGGVDLAALRIYDRRRLPSLSLARPESVKVGQNIFVIGTPLEEDYQNTLSQGIISRLDPQKGQIQHSANTNPGNSGGPVLNSQGQVVGVHYQGDLQSLVYDAQGKPIGYTKSGINFAISLDRLQAFLKAIERQDLSSVSTLARSQENQPILSLILNGQTIQGELKEGDSQLQDGSYYDTYQFQGRAGQRISLDMSSQQINPVLTLYRVIQSSEGEKFEKIADNDDRAPGDFNAQIAIELPTDGVYVVLANCLEQGESGKYTLRAASNP